MSKEEFLENIRKIISNNQEVYGIKNDDNLKAISVVLGINFKRWSDEEIYTYLKGMYDMINILNNPWNYFVGDKYEEI